jgi:prepilin-type N-terminal cleavage/methylation domain-containing protein
MKKNLNKGFTLIELLVVIAIIGILASVILASLNTARAKGADAAVKADLSNARAQAEIYYDNQNPNGYTGVCTATTANSGIVSMIADAALKAGTTVGAPSAAQTAYGSSTGAAVCKDASTTWVASVQEKSVSKFFCVDSTGTAKEVVTALGASATACPAS